MANPLNQVLPPLTNLPETSLQQHHQSSRAGPPKPAPRMFNNRQHQQNNGNRRQYSPNSPNGETDFPHVKHHQPHLKGDLNTARNTGVDPSRTSPQTDLLSTIPKEQNIGKPISDDYDELDMMGVLDTRTAMVRGPGGATSHGLVDAVRDELMRLSRGGNEMQDGGGQEIGPL